MHNAESTTISSPLTRQQRLARLGADHADTVVTASDVARTDASKALVAASVADLFDAACADVAVFAESNRAAFNADGLDVWAA